MIQANHIRLSFGERRLFNDISFDLKEDQRIGLVGANGSGKSTLLEAMVGLQALDGGTIAISKRKRVAYLAQDVVLSSSLSILDETLSAFSGLVDLQERLAFLERQLTEEQEIDLEEYAELHEKLADKDPDFLATKAKKMLMGLGFKEKDFQNPVFSLSVGWRMRIVLAKLLLQEADFYLFDEPTNHLDIFAKDWFLEFLKNAPFGFMLVCHERYFLDALCDDILELEMGKGAFYHGNYSSYEVQKEHNRTLLEAAYLQQQKEMSAKQELINKFRAGTRAKQAQSMLKQLDKVERIVLPPTLKNIKISFPPVVRSGTQVLRVEQVGFSFEGKEIFSNIDFSIERGQKVALVASNGIGKSTLLNLINGKLPLQRGTITFGAHVSTALFDQDQNAALETNKTILANIEQRCPGISTAAIRSLLGAFLFSGEDVDKKVSVLSGGEKNRVGMVSTLLQKANFLLLDEPTNHLDIDAKKILLQALRAYEGTLLFVSHDRAFLNDLATRVIELTPTGVIAFEGNYDQFLYYKKHMRLQEASPIPIDQMPKQKSPSSVSKGADQALKQSRKLEKLIDQLEKKVIAIEFKFAELRYGTPDYEAAQQELRLLKEQLSDAMKEWEVLQ